MNTFHSRQTNCDRHARKNANASPFKFTSQIASSICTVAFTKCEKSDATIFTSRCSRLSLICIFIHRHALLLSFVRFLRLAHGSSKFQWSPARWPRNGRESSGKTTGEMSRPNSHICRAIAGLWQMQYRRMSARQLARQLASWRATDTQYPRRSPRNSRCNIPRNIAQDDLPEFSRHLLKYDSQKL